MKRMMSLGAAIIRINIYFDGREMRKRPMILLALSHTHFYLMRLFDEHAEEVI